MNEMKLQILEEFADWVKSHKDATLKGKIATRLNQLQSGNFGDHKSVGGSVSEMRIQYGSGYRLYYTIRERVIV
ncbi:MAG: hypothetical protein LBD94_02435, partial [Rickettsiales bacterium]|nr:hypothetical protein [Rickettsiales bacterium]